MPDDQLNRLIDDYAAANAACEKNREDKLTFANFDRARFIQADQQAKWVLAELKRAQDALCLYVLAHREELRIDA